MMKYYLTCLIVIFFFSCHKAEKIIKIEENTSFSEILKKDSDDQNILIFIKNDGCDVCKEFNKYVELNFEKSVAPKLPENTKTYTITINDFKKPNMWLFHVLEMYSFPVVLYIEKGMNIKGMFKGGDLYGFDNFLNNLSNKAIINEPKIALNTDKLQEFSLLFKAYVDLKENNAVSESTYKQIRKLYGKKSNLISAVIEAYYYKKNNIYPERIIFIKNLLQKSIADTSSFYISHQKLVKEL